MGRLRVSSEKPIASSASAAELPGHVPPVWDNTSGRRDCAMAGPDSAPRCEFGEVLGGPPSDLAGVLDESRRSALEESGFVVLEDLMPPELLDALRGRVAELYAIEGDRAGAEFKQEPGCGRL